MKTVTTAALAAFILGTGAVSAQQSVLIPWNQSWKFMHPMGAFPDVPVGGDVDFETTWYLRESSFLTQYNGPLFGATPRQAGVPATTNSYDSGISQGPIGYTPAIAYFNSVGAEFTAFGDDDGDALNGRAGELSTPASGQRRAAYFRTTFSVPAGAALVRPKIRYLIDDGAYIYLDGELVAAVNMAATTPPNRDEYSAAPQVNAANATNTEDVLRLLDLSLSAGASTGAVPSNAALAANARIVKQVLSLSPGEHTLAVSARSNSQTSSDMVVAIELSAEVGCTIGATTSNVTRNNAGTPFNPSDDSFSFDVNVTGVNAGASWSSNTPGSPGGAFGVPVNLGPFPIAQSPLSFTIAAASDATCTTPLTVTAPGGSISAAAQSFARDLRGTVNEADDTFTAMVVVSSQFASGSWVSTNTTPVAASGGTPGSGSYGTPVLFGPYAVSAGQVTVTLADSANSAITTQIVLGSPIFLGSKAINGTLTDLLSAAPLPAQWASNNAVPPTITMANAGGDIWREFRSEVVNLSAAGAVAFNAELVARETSTTSNFETIDAFRAKLLLTGPGGTSEISLITPYDTNMNGMINGVDTPYDENLDEFNLQRQPVTVSLNNVLRLEAVIPASTTSAQLVVEGKGIAASEFFDVRALSFSDRCAFTVAATGSVRRLNGQPGNTAAHTAEFTLRATSVGLVSAAGWSVAFDRGGVPVTGANITGGAYNTGVLVTGLPAEGGPITATLTDRGDPACKVSVVVTVPAAPSLLGRASLSGVNSDFFTSAPITNWTSIPSGLEMNNSPAISDFTSEAINLSAINRPVYFSMTLQARETSTTSNFETADIFLAELRLDDGATVTTVNLITPFDRAVDGQMNGNATVTLDDFNSNNQAVSALLDNRFDLSAVIPSNIVSAVLRLRARNDSASEFFQVRDILFTTTSPSGGGDSDGDGVSDANEVIAGTNPNDATSVFRVTAITTAAGISNAGFRTVSGRFYRGYTSTNLITWTRDDSIAAIAGDGNPAVWPLPQAGAPARFLRIAVASNAGDFPATMP